LFLTVLIFRGVTFFQLANDFSAILNFISFTLAEILKTSTCMQNGLTFENNRSFYTNGYLANF